MSVLRAEGLRKSYRKRAVVDGVSIELAQGEIVALLGPCLLYTSPSPRDRTSSRMPSSAGKKNLTKCRYITRKMMVSHSFLI